MKFHILLITWITRPLAVRCRKLLFDRLNFTFLSRWSWLRFKADVDVLVDVNWQLCFLIDEWALNGANDTDCVRIVRGNGGNRAAPNFVTEPETIA